MRHLGEAVFIVPAISAIAERRNLFSAHGIEVRRTLVPSSQAQLDDLVAGRVQVGITATDNLFVWNAAGADLALIGQIESTTSLVLMLRPGLRSHEDVDVLRLAVDAPTNGFAVVAYAMMEQLGRDRSAFAAIAVGGVSERFDALTRGTADATLVSAPLDEIGQSRGMSPVMCVHDLVPSYPGLGIVTPRSMLESESAEVGSYLRALEDALVWMRDTSPPVVADELAGAGFGPAATRSVLDTLPSTVAPTPAGLDVLVRLRERVGMAVPNAPEASQLIDPRPARAAGLLACNHGGEAHA